MRKLCVTVAKRERVLVFERARQHNVDIGARILTAFAA